MMVWIDGSVRPAAAPLQHSDVARPVILVTAPARVALTLVLAAAGALPHVMAVPRRLAAWDGEWAAAGPGARAAVGRSGRARNDQTLGSERRVTLGYRAAVLPVTVVIRRAMLRGRAARG